VKNSLPQGASELLARSVLAGFSDRVAQKRKLAAGVARGKAHEVELVLSSGGSAILEETPSMAGEEFFILLDLQEQQNHDQRKSNLRVRSWIPMAEDWLLDVKPIGIEESEECTWDVQRKKVITVSRLKYGELVLSESASKSGDSNEVTRVLMKKGLGIDPESATTADWISVLTPLTESPDAREIESAFARAKIYMDHEKRELRDLWTHLSPLLGEKSSLAELRDVDWPSEVLQSLVGDDVHRLREALPTQLTLPSGRKAKIYYPLSQSPWVQSRLQDFFGMKKGPVLLKGRLPLLIHLLAPNQRPVQVTSDLEGFWKNHYPKLRPALSRRYPRHAWPENPGENGHE
jgi:ATP-dependent helicase HrpB